MTADPVAIFSCVSTSTSGFRRTETGARQPSARARACDHLELAEGLDVDGAHSGPERGVDLVGLLADAGEQDPIARHAGQLAPVELSAGDDVGSQVLGRRDS